MPASVITWLTKIDGFDLDDPQKNVNASDMNEIKTSVNANAALHDTLQSNFTNFTGTTFQGTFVENEVPAGTINGVNTGFTILNTAIVGSTKLYHNGIRLKSGGVDYTHSGTTITFVTPPETGDILLIDYRK